MEKLKPGLLYSQAPELCPCWVARRCGPSQGCNPIDLKETLASVFTLISNLDCPTKDQGWVGAKYKGGDLGGTVPDT